MKSIFILHEGDEKKTNDNKLIRLLIEHLKLNIDIVDFRGMGSKNNFFKLENYKLLKQAVDTNQIEKILFIVDADSEDNDAIYGGFENTKRELNNIIAQLSFQAVSSIYIMCDPNTKSGYLESFVLASLPDERKKCIDNFVQCSEINPKQIHKTIIHGLYKIAYPDPPYNFDHPHFDLLKTELINLFK
jgi:hypothetical protein